MQSLSLIQLLQQHPQTRFPLKGYELFVTFLADSLSIQCLHYSKWNILIRTRMMIVIP